MRSSVSRTRAAVVGHELFILGTLDSSTHALLLPLLRAHPEVGTLVLTANGGSIDDAANLELGRALRRREIATRVASRGVIASGAVDLFLAGARRSIGVGAKVGVHSWEHCFTDDAHPQPVCKQAKDHPVDDPGHGMHRDYTVEMLGSDVFYWFSIEAAGSDSIHWMSSSELAEHQLGGVADAPGFEQPFGEAFERERRDILGPDAAS
ncbi:MAG: hypothetical protein ACRBN8_21140 [Nannocystales bacterium]